MTAFGQGLCQSFTVPTVILDSMIFEVRKGRACDTLQRAQAKELELQGKELIQTNASLTLLRAISATQTLEASELRQSLEASKEAGRLKEKKARKSGRLQGLSIGGLAVILVLLL